MKEKRSLKNIFVRPSQQLKFSGVFLALIALMTAVYVSLIIDGVLNELRNMSVEYQLPPATVSHIMSSLMSAFVVIGLASIVLVVCMLVLALYMSHRIYGPLVPIERLVDHLKNGDYTVRAGLRKGDEFKELMEKLNKLAANLQERHGPGPGAGTGVGTSAGTSSAAKPPNSN